MLGPVFLQCLPEANSIMNALGGMYSFALLATHSSVFATHAQAVSRPSRSGPRRGDHRRVGVLQRHHAEEG